MSRNEPSSPMNRNMAMTRLLSLGVSSQGAQQVLAGMPVSDPRDRSVVSGLLLRVLAAEPGMRMAELYDYPGAYAQRFDVAKEAAEPGSGKVSSRMIAENY